MRVDDRSIGLIMYLSGDNNLKPYLRRELKKAERASLEADRVQLAAEIDAGKTYRILVRGGRVERREQPEADMISPQHLKEFLLWATKSIPSRELVLVISSHGSPYGKLISDKVAPSKLKTLKRFLHLEPHMMPMKTFVQVLEEVQNELRKEGKEISTLVLDACSLGTAQFIYQLAGVVPTVIASPTTIGAYGLSMSNLIRAMDREWFTPKDLVYSQASNPEVTSLTAVDTEKFKVAMDKLGELIWKLGRKHADSRERFKLLGNILKTEMRKKKEIGLDIFLFLDKLGEVFPEDRKDISEVEALVRESVRASLNPERQVNINLLVPLDKLTELDKNLGLWWRSFGADQS